MVTLISQDYELIQVMTRFGIKMGFGEKNVAEVCMDAGVDCNTFLAVVNFVVEGFTTLDTSRPISIKSLVHYLKQSHIYFLDYYLPLIRRKLLDGIELNGEDVSFLIIKFFDEYYGELRGHMEYEEKNVFKYIDHLLAGERPDNFHISTYSDHHEQVSTKLGELKNLILRYCPSTADANLLNDALYNIYRCEKELENHCKVEDQILIPEILRLEQLSTHPLEKDGKEPLSLREKEIITLVTKGLTNKEIADRLFLSVHTVITHRRNIARKLEIHSATGLTIYAIVNKLIDISEVNL